MVAQGTVPLRNTIDRQSSDRNEVEDITPVEEKANVDSSGPPRFSVQIDVEQFVETCRRFELLVERWYNEIDPYSSSSNDWIMTLPYQQIIGLGPIVIPLVLRELQSRPHHWFWALRVLTDAEPVPAESRGDFDDMVSAWLKWGRDNGYL